MADSVLQQQQICPLMNVPPELHLEVTDHLNELDRMRLRLTNRYFRQAIKPLKLNELANAQQQHWHESVKIHLPHYHPVTFFDPKVFACMNCLQLRFRNHFEKLRSRPLYSTVYGVAYCCIDCEKVLGLRPRLKPRFLYVRSVGMLLSWCSSCEKFKEVHVRETRLDDKCAACVKGEGRVNG